MACQIREGGISLPLLSANILLSRLSLSSRAAAKGWGKGWTLTLMVHLPLAVAPSTTCTTLKIDRPTETSLVSSQVRLANFLDFLW